jgi:toluene monooxygenase system protein E
MMAQRTYWHLEGAKRVPTPYELGTSRLLYYGERGFEVETPIADWYRRHQKAAPLAWASLERFRDPRETTYSKYVALAQEREAFIDGLLRSALDGGHDEQLAAEWLGDLERWLPVLLYPCHGLQMVAAYVGQLAPTSELVVAFAFQAGDDMRRIQRLAYRVKQLERLAAGFSRGKERWQSAPEWQPLRRVIEELLVTYDLGEALAALTLVVRPWFDAFFVRHGSRVAEAAGDALLSRVLFSLHEDCSWHRALGAELWRVLLDGSPAGRDFVDRVVDARLPAMRAAVEALEPIWDARLEPFARVLDAIDDDLAAERRSLGLGAGS